MPTTGGLNPGGNAGANASAANVGQLTTGALTRSSSTATALFDLGSGTVYDRLQVSGNVALLLAVTGVGWRRRRGAI